MFWTTATGGTAAVTAEGWHAPLLSKHTSSMFQVKGKCNQKLWPFQVYFAATSQYTIKSLWLQWEWLVEASKWKKDPKLVKHEAITNSKTPMFHASPPNWRLCTRNMRTFWKCEGLFCQHCRMAIPLPTWPWSKTGAMATVDERQWFD